MALTSGILRIDASSGCLWLESEGADDRQLLIYGDAATRVDVLSDPPAVRKGEDVLGVAGDLVELTGFFAPGGTLGVPDCPVVEPLFTGGLRQPR